MNYSSPIDEIKEFLENSLKFRQYMSMLILLFIIVNIFFIFIIYKDFRTPNLFLYYSMVILLFLVTTAILSYRLKSTPIKSHQYIGFKSSKLNDFITRNISSIWKLWVPLGLFLFYLKIHIYFELNLGFIDLFINKFFTFYFLVIALISVLSPLSNLIYYSFFAHLIFLDTQASSIYDHRAALIGIIGKDIQVIEIYEKKIVAKFDKWRFVSESASRLVPFETKCLFIKIKTQFSPKKTTLILPPSAQPFL